MKTSFQKAPLWNEMEKIALEKCAVGGLGAVAASFNTPAALVYSHPFADLRPLALKLAKKAVLRGLK